MCSSKKSNNDKSAHPCTVHVLCFTGELYDPTQNICCGDALHEKENKACCGSNLHTVTTDQVMCCGGELHNNSQGQERILLDIVDNIQINIPYHIICANNIFFI